MSRLWRDIPALLICAVVLTVTANTFLSNWLFSGLTGSVEENQFQSVEAIFTASLRGAEDRALARAQMIADLPATKSILAGRDAAARERLLAEYLQMFE